MQEWFDSYPHVRDPVLTFFEELGAIRTEVYRRRNLINLEIDTHHYEMARAHCKNARARLDKLDRDLHDELERLETVYAEIPEQ